MSLINVSNLTFAYEGDSENIFEKVSFQIDTDWKLGFTGRNGRGKTTFLNLLLGKYEYSGSITSSVNFEYFPYEVHDKKVKTLNVIRSILVDFEEWRLLRELSLLEVDEDVLSRPFETLSNGEQTKVLLALLFLRENSFLLIDEPTNHLDLNGRKLVSRYLNNKKGFILVSHDRAFLDGCIDHILSINKTNIEIQKGNFSSWQLNKERIDSFELAENEKLKKEIGHLKKAAERTSNWSDKVEKTKIAKTPEGRVPDRGYVGHKAAKMMKRSKSIESRRQTALDDKSKLLKNIEEAEELKINQLKYHSKRLLAFSEVSISYGEKRVCENISFTVEQGERILLSGKNGSGKSSILKLICGESVPFSGNFQKGCGLNISYVPQDTSFLRGSLSEYICNYDLEESLFKAILRKLDFSRKLFEKSIEELSAGQKKKLLIAKSLSEKAHLLVWDEPLNYIDVISRIQIEKLLLEYKPTMVFTEHDFAFCDSIYTIKINL